MGNWLFWLIAVIVFAAVEVVTVNVVSVWFVGGAAAALVASLLGAGTTVQIILFIVVSVALLACLRPFVKKFVTPRKTPTNADRLVGKTALITETVDGLHATGALKLDGKEWSVRSADGGNIKEGSLVKVVAIEGVKLVVEPALVEIS